MTTTQSGGQARRGTAGAWIVLDGANARGHLLLAETPKLLRVVTVAGSLSPIDPLHLQGDFGIPRFDGDEVKGAGHR